MNLIVPIVEGHGELEAFPVLLRRLANWIAPQKYIDISQPIRTQRDKFINDATEFSKMLKLAQFKARDNGQVMLFLDADDDCPVLLTKKILGKATSLMPNLNLSVVIANREYEAWFLAAANSINGLRGLALIQPLLSDPDQPRDAKGWLARQMTDGYNPMLDQPAFSATFSLEEAWIGSRSFRRLCNEFIRISENVAE
jgi:Domain of unknown function (DUF4276)